MGCPGVQELARGLQPGHAGRRGSPGPMCPPRLPLLDRAGVNKAALRRAAGERRAVRGQAIEMFRRAAWRRASGCKFEYGVFRQGGAATEGYASGPG